MLTSQNLVFLIPAADFPGGPVAKNSPCSAGDGDMSLIPGGGTKILQAKKNLNNGSNSRFLLLLPCGHVNLSSSFTS